MSEIISKAMNSTLGTNKFKAFDELLLDSKSIIPGDDIVNRFSNDNGDYWTIGENVVTKTETEIVKFTMPLSGRIMLKYQLMSYSKDKYAYLYVYVNNVLYVTKSATDYGWDDTASSIFISANRGDVITIKGKSAYSTTADGVTEYNFRARLYDVRYNIIDAPALIMTKSV